MGINCNMFDIQIHKSGVSYISCTIIFKYIIIFYITIHNEYKDTKPLVVIYNSLFIHTILSSVLFVESFNNGAHGSSSIDG